MLLQPIFKTIWKKFNETDYTYIMPSLPDPNDDVIEGNEPLRAVDGGMVDGQLEGNDATSRVDGNVPTGPPDMLDFLDGNDD